MNDIEFKYWEGGHILVGDCFLRNEALNPMINWLNLHCSDIVDGYCCDGVDKINEVSYASAKGFMVIVTNRDIVMMEKKDVERFVAWLNEQREVLNIREIVKCPRGYAL